MSLDHPAGAPRALPDLDAGAFLRWAAVARSSFAARRAEIDSLNVFPVPDGDTGTNLYLTLDAAIDSARTALDRDPTPDRSLAGLGAMCREMSRAMLLTARGNSGVILSQLFRGFADHVLATGVSALDGAGLAGALARADQLAWRAVTEPKEGTILSVSRATVEATGALIARNAGVHLGEVVAAAAAAAERALEHTPAQLPVLARAGVVDAGGAGYVLLMEALQRVVTGHGPAVDDPLRRRPGWSHPATPPGRIPQPGGDAEQERPGPAYEVMYLLTDSDDARVEALRARLARLGDSLLVVGAEGTWNVHVHVDEPGAAIEAGIEAGRPHRIVVTHFGDPVRRAVDPTAQAVVACAAGEGLAEVFRAAGATVVLSGPGRRASAGQLVEAIRSCGAGQVLVLPNDADTELAAHAAAGAAAEVRRGGGTRAAHQLDPQVAQQVRVVRSRTAVQGVAALAVFDPHHPLEANLEAMTAAATGTRHGAVTVARKEALTSAGICHVGDVLGVIDGDFAIVGADLAEVAGQVIEALLGDDGELLTVISGDDAPADLVPAVVAAARIRRRDLEVAVIHGGQPLYPLLLGVE